MKVDPLVYDRKMRTLNRSKDTCFMGVSNYRSLGNIPLGSKAYLCSAVVFRGKDNCSSLVKAEEMKELLVDLSPDNYKSGEYFSANLHIHSTASDGELTPSEILGQAKRIADDLPAGKHFLFSVTDHDSLDGAKEVARIIQSNPDVYKKIKFVPGIEFTVKYTQGGLLDKPLQLDMLAYGFDPNNSEINGFVDTVKRRNMQSVNEFFGAMNERYPKLNLSVSEASKTCPAIRNIGSAGLNDSVINYTAEKTSKSGISAFDVLGKLFKVHFGDAKNLTKATPEMIDVIEVITKNGGAVSLAHPGRIDLSGRIKDGKDGFEVTNQLLKDFSKAGGVLIEGQYQNYKDGSVDWWHRIKSGYEKIHLDFISTGGYDTHGRSIGEYIRKAPSIFL